MKFYSHERVLCAWVGKIVPKIGIADNPFIFFRTIGHRIQIARVRPFKVDEA